MAFNRFQPNLKEWEFWTDNSQSVKQEMKEYLLKEWC